MKRFFSLIVTFGLLLSLAGCVVYDVKEDHTETKEQLQEIPKQPPKNTVPKKTEPQETPPEETEYPVPPELKSLITAAFAEEGEQGDIFFLGDESEYAVRLAFTAEEDVTYQFCRLIWERETYETDFIFTENTLKAGQTFVAQVDFPGDMTTYGIHVTDQNGSAQYYAVYISGKDGSLVCQSYEPVPPVQIQYDNYLGSFCYHIPVVELPGVNTQRINQLLYETHYENLKENALDIPEQPFLLGMLYSVGQKGDIVSVMVQESCDCDLTYYCVYNFSASTGEEIPDADVFAAFGLTEKQGRENIKNSLSDYWDQRIQQIGAEGMESYKNDTLSNGNLANCRPFIDENGELRYTCIIYSPAGADSYQWILDDNGNAWRESCRKHQ